MESGCTSLFMTVGEYYNSLSCSALMMPPHPIDNTLQPLNRQAMSPEELHRDKIMSHPYYHRLLAAYVNCQKIGAPPEMAARLEEAACAGACAAATMRTGGVESGDPALDQFMEAYCEMLIKYEQELSKPLTEATLFLARIEHQFQALTICLSDSEPAAKDEQLKGELLEKYRGCLGSLKQEFAKKKKKGKLPKEGRQKLLNWWSRHYIWPYPSEADKVALAESTGLEQKQINNWFINQRKRHWKPSNNTLD